MNSKFKFDKSSLLNRKEGISAFIRMKNGADTISYVVDSHIEIFDEIIILLNGCTDNSELVCNELAVKYPNKIRVFNYEPLVYPFGSEQHKLEPEDSIHSFVNYSNYALQLTQYNIVMKLDDDHYCPLAYRSRDSFFSEVDENKINYFSGINLAWSCDKSDLEVSRDYALAGNGDHFIFKVNKDTYFKKNDICEYLNVNGMPKKYIGLRYFHLKFLRKNYGFSNVNKTNEGKTLYNIVDKMARISYSDFYEQCKNIEVVKNKSYFTESFFSILKRKFIENKIIISLLFYFNDFYSQRAKRLGSDLGDILKYESFEDLNKKFEKLKKM